MINNKDTLIISLIGIAFFSLVILNNAHAGQYCNTSCTTDSNGYTNCSTNCFDT